MIITTTTTTTTTIIIIIIVMIIFIGTYKRTQLKCSTKKKTKIAKECASYNRHVR